MSTDQQAVIDGTADVTVLTEAGYVPSSLDMETTYYWKIDEFNDVETPAIWYGDTFSFTTTNFISVDDFEDYDAGSNEIWWAWKDGIGYASHPTEPPYAGNETGAAVGTENTLSYTEEVIVHGGRQSMPLSYNNTGAANYSETTRTFDEPQNWTDHAIEILSLWFHGDPSNLAGQLYVKINDGGEIPYNGDAGDLAIEEWHVWNIDLASTGQDLQSVRSLTIGIKNVGATGTLLIDDIGLYRTAPELVSE